MEQLLENMLRQAVGERADHAWRQGSSGQIVEALNSNDEIRQLQALEALCTELNMATPITLTMMNTSAIVPPLLGCLRKEHNPELQLMSARALTYMADSLPRTLDILSNGTNVEPLLEPVAAIQDVELAEQCLSCVEKLCQTPSGAASVFRCSGVSIMLGFVDFFTTGTQRKIWSSVSRACKCIDCDSFDRVRDALRPMRDSLQNADDKIRSKALSALLRVMSGVRKKSEMVDEVFSDVPHVLIAMLTKADTDEATFGVALSLIQAAVTFSANATKLVIESGLLTALLNLLDGSASTAVGEDALGTFHAAALDDPSSPAVVVNESMAVPNTSLAGAAAASAAAGARASEGGASPGGAAKRRTLSFENSKVLCSIFTAMLVPNRDGAFAFIHELMQLELKEAAALMMAPFDANKDAGVNGGDGDDGDEEEDEEEYEDEDSDEQHETQPNLDELRARIHATPGLHLKQTAEYARFRNANHICDSCDKTCVLGDWYRCNDCRDADFCGACLLREYAAHEGGEHSFCDMQALHEATPAKPKEHSQEELRALAMYRARPDLLADVLHAVPKVVVLCTQSEAAVIRASGMHFLLSAATMASPELLRSAGMNGADVCEAMMTALMDSSLYLNITGVALASRLLEKLPREYADTLVREGVASALLQLQKRYAPSHSKTATPSTSGSPAASAAVSDPAKPILQKKVQTLDGWRGIAEEEINKVFRTFPALKSTSRSSTLVKLVRLLKENKMREAFVALRDALLSHTTAYEFASENVFHELKECLIRADDNIEEILRCVMTLCEDRRDGKASASTPASPSSSLLAEFVHLLHTALAHLDQFAAPSFGSIRSIHSRIPLELVPHTPDPPQLSSFPKNPSSAATKRGGTDRNGDEGASSGPVARVNIEPLANAAAIANFISLNLLYQSTNPRAMRGASATAAGGDEDDSRVEDVLPELGKSHDGSKPKAKKSKMEDTPGVWVRYKDNVLPLSMTMIQLMQSLVKTRAKGQEKGTAAGGGDAETIRLHYSPKPFEAHYKMARVFKDLPRDFDLGAKLVLPSKEARPDAVGRVLAQVHQPFAYSRSYLTEAQIDILTLLGVLHETVNHWAELLQFLSRRTALNEEDESVWSPSVSCADFVHRKLNNKAMRHCSNLLLAGQHTSLWAVNLALDCNFLFAPSTRKFMFEISFCGTGRSLARMQQNLAKYGVRDSSSADHNSSRNIQLTREKKRVWRQFPLECAMELLGGARVSGMSSWEFEFYDEAGSGLGPTREFYTLVAKALRERSRKLWRPTNEAADDKYFTPLNGLYPRPISTDATEAALDGMTRYFKFIGRFLGRALLDEHVASLPLSPVLLKLFRGDVCGIHDVRDISESLGDVLLAIMDASEKKTDVIHLPGQKKGYPVESMSLSFTLPGDDSVELCSGGASVEVSKSNMVDYCDAVTNHMLNVGVSYAVTALREGFNDYIPLMAVRMLSVDELFEVINGYTQPITRQEFEDNCSADHGFTLACNHVQWLFDILASFDLEQQRRFFLFLTGSPHLPVGGLASLRPKLTIVRKTSSEASVKETDQLPSAMTCQHYLKLPAYSSRAQMEEKLRQAIHEGTGAFLLS